MPNPAAGCHVPRSIPPDGQGEEEAAPGSRGHAAVGLNIDRLKPHTAAAAPAVAQPPPRGRPRKS